MLLNHSPHTGLWFPYKPFSCFHNHTKWAYNVCKTIVNAVCCFITASFMFNFMWKSPLEERQSSIRLWDLPFMWLNDVMPNLISKYHINVDEIIFLRFPIQPCMIQFMTNESLASSQWTFSASTFLCFHFTPRDVLKGMFVSFFFIFYFY